uniref:Uncharacterized protein n=1 Tax=viral metagenome TaxID=1070528 RepID=A0A6H1ZQ25_9ZZZZ
MDEYPVSSDGMHFIDTASRDCWTSRVNLSEQRKARAVHMTMIRPGIWSYPTVRKLRAFEDGDITVYRCSAVDGIDVDEKALEPRDKETLTATAVMFGLDLVSAITGLAQKARQIVSLDRQLDDLSTLFSAGKLDYDAMGKLLGKVARTYPKVVLPANVATTQGLKDLAETIREHGSDHA